METKIQDVRGHFGLPSQDASKVAKWWPMSSKMEPKWSPKGTKWREDGPKIDKKNRWKMKPWSATVSYVRQWLLLVFLWISVGSQIDFVKIVN